MKYPLLLLLLILSGCATTPHPIQKPDNLEQQLTSLQSWNLNGKLGYRSANQGGSAWIDWQQRAQNFILTLSGPFGAGTTLIEGSENHAVLQRAGQPPLVAENPAELTETLFGWQWPVEDLLYWVKGIPSAIQDVESATYNEQGLLTELQQGDWALKFSNHSLNDDGLILPGKVIGKRDEISFTLVVKSWQLDTTDAN